MIELSGFAVDFGNFGLGPLSLGIRPGERVALVGPNGAGKSTTLRAIAGLLTGGYVGSVRVGGVEVADAGPAIRHTVGLLPERLPGFGWMTVAEHFAFLASFHPAWDRDRAEELRRRLRVPAGTKLAHLSKGMRIKTSFAATEAYRPAILLLDEPTSGIDPVMRDDLLSLLRECTPPGDGRILVFSSHILEDVERVADRVLLLREGELLEDAAVADLREAAADVSVPEHLVRLLRVS